jgi:hypothetical protein
MPATRICHKLEQKNKLMKQFHVISVSLKEVLISDLLSSVENTHTEPINKSVSLTLF